MIEQFYLYHSQHPNKYYQSRSVWTWELWLWRGSSHSPNSWTEASPSDGLISYSDYLYRSNVYKSEYMCKEDLALNNLQWLICHKTQPTKIDQMFINQNIYIQGKLSNFFISTQTQVVDWLILILICLGLFYALKLGNCVHCTFIFVDFVQLFLKDFWFLLIFGFCCLLLCFFFCCFCFFGLF